MRIIPILTAAALGIVASYGLANAQATNMAPQSGTAKTLSGTGTDVNANQQQASKKSIKRSTKKAMKKKSKKSAKRM